MAMKKAVIFCFFAATVIFLFLFLFCLISFFFLSRVEIENIFLLNNLVQFVVKTTGEIFVFGLTIKIVVTIRSCHRK